MLTQIAFEAWFGKCKQQNDKTIRLARELKSTGRTLSEVVLFSCVVIFLRHVEELFRKSAAERGRCCSTVDDFSGRVTSTWTVLLDADHQLDDSGSFAKLQRKRPGRLVWTRLLHADTPTEQFIGLLVIRRRSQILPTHTGSTWFDVNVRLTARLQSLLLARCWPACFAILVLYSLLFCLTLTVVHWLYVCFGHYHKNELYEVFVWRLIAKILWRDDTFGRIV